MEWNSHRQPGNPPGRHPCSSMQTSCPAPTLQGRQLLLVGAWPTTQRTLQALLERQGARLLFADSLTGGQYRLQPVTSDIDVLILDLRQHERLGQACAISGLAAGPLGLLPILGLHDGDEVAQARDPCDAVLAWPCQPALLLDELQRLMHVADIVRSRPREITPPHPQDIAEALKQLDDDRAIYAMVLQAMVAQQSDFCQRIRHLLQHDHNDPGAVLLAHTLKGSALTLGARGLADAAARLEKLLRQAAGLPLVLRMLDHVEAWQQKFNEFAADFR